FVAAVYRDVLGREADPAGGGAWARLLQSDPAGGRARGAEGVFASAEFRQVLVQSFYTQFLRRPTDSVGLAAFALALARGGREQDVIAAVVASDEYFARATR